MALKKKVFTPERKHLNQVLVKLTLSAVCSSNSLLVLVKQTWLILFTGNEGAWPEFVYPKPLNIQVWVALLQAH